MHHLRSHQQTSRRALRHALRSRGAVFGLALLTATGGAFAQHVAPAGAADDLTRVRATVVTDRDGDGFSDDVETLWGTNPDDPTDRPPELVSVAATHGVAVVPAQMAAEVVDQALRLPDGLVLQSTIVDPVTGTAVTKMNPMSGLKGIFGFDPSSGVLSDPMTGISIDTSSIVDPVTGRPIGSKATVGAGFGPLPEFIEGRGPDAAGPYAEDSPDGGTVTGKDCVTVCLGLAPNKAQICEASCWAKEQPTTCANPKESCTTLNGSKICDYRCPDSKYTDPEAPASEVPTTGTGRPPGPKCEADGCGSGGPVEPGRAPDVPSYDPYANYVPDAMADLVLPGVLPAEGCQTDGKNCGRPDLMDGFVSLIVQGLSDGTPN